MVTYGLIVTRSGKVIKENRKDSKIINQQIVSKLTKNVATQLRMMSIINNWSTKVVNYTAAFIYS